jgi:hypothetical protein
MNVSVRWVFLKWTATLHVLWVDVWGVIVICFHYWNENFQCQSCWKSNTLTKEMHLHIIHCALDVSFRFVSDTMLPSVERATTHEPTHAMGYTFHFASLCHWNYFRNTNYYLHISISSFLILFNNRLSIAQGDFKCLIIRDMEGTDGLRLFW